MSQVMTRASHDPFIKGGMPVESNDQKIKALLLNEFHNRLHRVPDENVRAKLDSSLFRHLFRVIGRFT